MKIARTRVALLALAALVATGLAPSPAPPRPMPPGMSATTVRVGPFVLPPASRPRLPVLNQFTAGRGQAVRELLHHRRRPEAGLRGRRRART